MKISVIVPVYKVEEYIHQCIDSILTQTFTDFELILVDDGSPDNCGKICDEYSTKDSRIRVIHKENGGLSSARNAGLDIAQGEYIAFVDSDDWIDKNMLHTLIHLLQKENCDISICSYKRTSSREETSDIKTNYTCLDGKKAVSALYSAKTNIAFTTAWGKLYKRTLFKRIKYPEKKYHEDEFITYKLLYNSTKIIYTESKLYFYYINPQSIIQSKFSEKNLDSLDAFKERIEYFKDKDEELCLLAKNNLIKRVMYCYQRVIGEIKGKNKKHLKGKTLSYIDSNYKKRYINSLNGKDKLWAKLFFLNPTIYSRLRNALKIGL